MSNKAREILEELSQTQVGAGRKKFLTQYVKQGNNFMAIPDTIYHDTYESLTPGIYDVISSFEGIKFNVHESATDEILRYPDKRQDEILDEMADFWEKKEAFKDMGFVHKRGVLLYGEPGTGKSCLLKLVMEQAVKNGDVVFISKGASDLCSGLKDFREVEKNRQVLAVLEDMDEIIRYGEHAILELFDGDSQVNNVLFLATTNYIHKLPKRILREGRFDRKIEIGKPPESGRKAYLLSKLGTKESKEDIAELAKKTKNFTFAQLREFLVSAYCLDKNVDKTIERINKGVEGLSESSFIKKWRFSRASKIFESLK